MCLTTRYEQCFSPLLLAGKWVRTGSSCRTFLNKTTSSPEDSDGSGTVNCGGEMMEPTPHFFFNPYQQDPLRVQF